MVDLPAQGQENWDVPLNAALNSLQDELDAHEVAADPHGAKAYADAAFVPQAVTTVTEWIASAPVIVAHRGSGAEYPEQTLAAFESIVAAGATAIEVSVHLTADSVPVVFHDTTLDRMTDSTGPIEDKTYAELRETIPVKAQGLLGSGWSDQPIPTMREVLDRFLGRVVIFLEAKSNPSVPVVQQMLTDFYPHANQSVVWKAYYTDNSMPWAQNNGFTTWGYFFQAEGILDADLTAVDDDVDWWGPEVSETPARLGEIVARGKPVIAHVVHRHIEQDKALDAGCDGIMCAMVGYLQNQPELASDTFDAQVNVGIVPFATYDPDYAIKHDGAGGGYTERLSGEAVCMGSNRVPTTDGYTISYSLKWDILPATTSQHADLVLGKASDDRFKYFATDNESAGYTIFHRATGEISVYTHTPGSSSSTQLGTLVTEAPVAGTYMTFTLQVTTTQVILTRTDTATPYELAVTDAQHRGQYWHFGNGSVSDQVAVWKDFLIS